MAARDIVHRGLRAAIILEDDAMVPSDLWLRLAALEAPADADVFYLGSYSSRATVGTLRGEPMVASSITTTASSTSPPSSEARLSIHRRTVGTKPLLVGTNAYVLFARAAAVLLQPIRAEADITLTFLDAPHQCRTQRGTAGVAPSPERCLLLHAPPAHQYGPSSWIVGQDLHGLEQKTHYDGPPAPRTRAAPAGRDPQVVHDRGPVGGGPAR